jgi:hypothetical protein
VDVVSCSVPEAQSLVDAGEIRALAVMADERLPGVPEVPTLQETGVDWTIATWRGLALPPGVPADRFRVLEEAARGVVESDEYARFLDQAGFGFADEGPERFGETMAEEDEAFGEIFASPAFASIREQTYGPWLFPTVIGLLTGLALVLSIVGRGREGGEGGMERPGVASGGLARVAGAVGVVVLYLLVADALGYVVTSALLLFGFFLLLRVRLPVAAFTSVVVAAASYHVFGVLLRVPLPWGVLGW